MTEQLQIDFNKITKSSDFSEKDIAFKKKYLKKFIEKGFPKKSHENWKFLDINQIIKKNIGDLSFYHNYSLPNKIDSSIFVDGLEHNKIIFINGRIEKINFNYEDKDMIEISDEVENKVLFENDSTSVGENIALENDADTGMTAYLLQETYIVGDSSTTKTAPLEQNELFDSEDDSILDFTEKNPFGDVGD